MPQNAPDEQIMSDSLFGKDCGGFFFLRL